MNTSFPDMPVPPVGNVPAAPERRSVLVWDIPTRLFHWLLVTLIVVGYVTAEGRGFVFTVHKISGYGALALVLFRLGWGFLGGRHALFADFVRPFRVVRAHLASVFARHPTPSIGHNPTGGWMVVALLAFVFIQVGTGLFATSRRGAGPLADWLTQSTARSMGNIHEVLFNILLLLIVVHVLGVIAESILGRENLVRPMVTGTKMLSTEDAAREATGNAGRLSIALLVLALAVGAVAIVVSL